MKPSPTEAWLGAGQKGSGRSRHNASLRGSRLALRELLILHHHVRGVYLLSLSVGIAACLNPSGDHHFQALTKIFLRELGASSEGDTADKVRVGLAVSSAESAVYRQRISGNRVAFSPAE